MFLETVRDSGVELGRCREMAKIACAAHGGDWTALTMSDANQTVQDKVKKYIKEGQEQFITALHFNDLNHTTYTN